MSNLAGYRQLVPLTEPELAAVFAQLDSVVRSAKAPKRSSDRASYRVGEVPVLIQHPGGGIGKYLCYTRDLTANGIGLLHGGFIHPGTVCEIVLTTILGDARAVRGKVAWCTHVSGKIHAVGVKFAVPIEPRSYMDPCLSGGIGARDDGNNAQVGVALMIDSEPMDIELLKIHFSETPVQLIRAGSKADAINIVENSPIDVVLVELTVSDGSAEEVVRDLRAGGYGGPFIVLTRDTNAERLSKAAALGAVAVIGKPYEPAKLIRLVMDQVAKSEVPVSDAPIYSALEGAIASSEPLQKYLELLAQMRDRVRKAMKDNDQNAAVSICQSLQGSAKGFGLPIIAQAARVALRRLDATNSVKESRDALLRLEMVLGRVRARGDAGSIAA